MAEIVYMYIFQGTETINDSTSVRWLSMKELRLFNEHLLLCGQDPLPEETWYKLYDEGTIYCVLFENGIPVARACVEKYSNEAWEVADVRVVKSYRNKGFAYRVSLFVLKYILDNGKTATIRTEEDNYSMQRVISKLGFMPLL